MGKTDEYAVFHAISGLIVDTPEPVSIGDFTFFQFPRDCRVALQKFFLNPSQEAIDSWFRDLKESPAVISVKVKANDTEAAEIEAENLFKRITNIFRFQLFSIGNDLFDVSVYDKSHITKSTYVVISKTDGKHHFSVSGVRRQIELSKFLETDCRGFENLIQQLTISKLTNFQKRVLLAVDFLGLATRNIGQPSGFVHAITAIETLLSMGKMGISQNIADNYAFIMGTDLENRKTLKQDTKKLYRIRSELAHGEKSIISVEDCKDAISHAYALILKFLFDDKLRHIQNNEQFVEYIENIKFADKREEI